MFSIFITKTVIIVNILPLILKRNISNIPNTLAQSGNIFQFVIIRTREIINIS